jgi:hypothetical protein
MNMCRDAFARGVRADDPSPKSARTIAGWDLGPAVAIMSARVT